MTGSATSYIRIVSAGRLQPRNPAGKLHRVHIGSKAIFFALLMGNWNSGHVNAEHRVALVVSQTSQNNENGTRAIAPGPLTTALTSHGFRCEQFENLSEKQLKSTIEDFSKRTPTLSTALVCFIGPVHRSDNNKAESGFLPGVDSRPGRGVPLSFIADTLHQKGGSRQNVILYSDNDRKLRPAEVPRDSLIAGVNPEFPSALATSGFADALTRFGRVMAQGIDVKEICNSHASVCNNPPEEFRAGRKAGEEWVNKRGMVFCWCPAGVYIAGSPEDTPGRYNDEEQREVKIVDGFWIGKYELTLGQNMRNTPRGTIAVDKNHPLTMLHHDDGKNMVIRTLTQNERKAERLPAEWEYSLPTEEQWEYAARAGTDTSYYFGDQMDSLPQHANFADRSWFETGDIYSNSAHRSLNDNSAALSIVGSYRANPWGLHDIYGNVAEWCINHAVRGGSWVSVPQNCRSAYRDSYSARNEQNYIGYRLVIQKVTTK